MDFLSATFSNSSNDSRINCNVFSSTAHFPYPKYRTASLVRVSMSIPLHSCVIGISYHTRNSLLPYAGGIFFKYICIILRIVWQTFSMRNLLSWHVLQFYSNHVFYHNKPVLHNEQQPSFRVHYNLRN